MTLMIPSCLGLDCKLPEMLRSLNPVWSEIFEIPVARRYVTLNAPNHAFKHTHTHIHSYKYIYDYVLLYKCGDIYIYIYTYNINQ